MEKRLLSTDGMLRHLRPALIGSWKMLALLLLISCGNSEKAYDATGTFEATETTVSAEQNGVLLTFDISEGDSITAGQEVALVDTTQLWLKKQQLLATKDVYHGQKPDMQKQIAATRRQLEKARSEQQRYQELVDDGAAPSKMLDDAKSQVEVLQRQLDAQMSTIAHQLSTLDAQLATVDIQVDQLNDQLSKCHVVAPVSGTVLEKYAERGEVVAAGKPLFTIADTGNMFLRAYVTSAQLQHISVGQPATVFADYGGNRKKEYAGKVVWISSRSEFTPKTIVTDDERADLVYAVKIAIKNDGFAKIGMYGEASFK